MTPNALIRFKILITPLSWDKFLEVVKESRNFTNYVSTMASSLTPSTDSANTNKPFRYEKPVRLLGHPHWPSRPDRRKSRPYLSPHTVSFKYLDRARDSELTRIEFWDTRKQSHRYFCTRYENLHGPAQNGHDFQLSYNPEPNQEHRGL